MAQSFVKTLATDADCREIPRRHAEILLSRAAHLPPSQCELINQVYRHGTTFRQLAKLTGISPVCWSRKVKNITKRMNTHEFTFLLARGDMLPAPVRRAAEMVHVQGMTLRQAAAASDMSLHQVRMNLRAFQALSKL